MLDLDINHLHGTPIPPYWTPNVGINLRPLEVGMELRFPGGDIYRVLSVSPGGADVIGWGRVREVAPMVHARTGNVLRPTRHIRTIRRMQISVLSEVDYRIDSGRSDMMEYAGGEMTDPHTDNDTGDHVMAKIESNAARAARVAGAPATPKTKDEKVKEKKVRQAKSLKSFLCLCGCGGVTGKYFVPGHDARFKSWLLKIAAGRAKPSELMPEGLAKQLGPWTKQGEGLVPSKEYTDLPRTEVAVEGKEEAA